MFTGIIQTVVPVARIEASAASARVAVSSGFTDLQLGESIAVNGVCLTVTESDSAGGALFFVSPETLAKSNLGSLVAGSLVNLERAVTLETRLSGHLVQGHVDGLGKLASILRQGRPGDESHAIHLEIPARLVRYCVEKGSICLNGVSLTINSIERSAGGDTALVAITLIPHTWEHTQFSRSRVGDPVNVEVDVLAKYVESLSRPYLAGLGGPGNADRGVHV